jgi:hypothetical protein
MMKALIRILAMILTLSATVQVQAQETEAGTLPGAFRSFIVRDERTPLVADKNRTSKLHCLVCANGLNPGIAVFSRSIPKEATAPLARLILKQDELAKKYAVSRLGVYTIFLGLSQLYEDDQTRETKTAEIANFGRAVNAKLVPLGLAEATVLEGDKPITAPQVKAYNIADADDITVVFYDRLKTIQTWKFAADKGPTAEDLAAMEKRVDEHFKK